MKDYSIVPCTKQLKNNTGNDVSFIIFNKISVTIKDGESLDVKCNISEHTSILEKKALELGLEIAEVEEVEVEQVTEKVTEIKTEFYNKSEGSTINSDTPGFEEAYYTEIADVEEANEISIGSTTFGKDEIKYVSVGKGSQIEAPVFEVKDGKLKVSPLYLLANADKDGNVEVSCGDKVYKLKLDGIGGEETVTIKSVEALMSKFGKVNEVTLEGNSINVKSDDGRHCVGVILQVGGEEILDPDTLIYRIDENNNMGITAPETMDSKKVTYGFYPKYKAEGYTEEDIEQYSRKIKLLIVDKGIVEFTVNFTPVVAEE